MINPTPSKSNSKKRKPNKKLWLILGISLGTLLIISAATIYLFNFFKTPETYYKSPTKIPAVQCQGVECVQRGTHAIEKPIIYLYPEEETDVSVRLGAPEKLTSTYPKYTDGWNLIAYPNGDLIDKATGNTLYSLYWEGTTPNLYPDKTTGFIVENTDTIRFLEEKLEILGLNYKEREEFIIYWLPKLEAHKFNYIYFASAEEIEQEMPLELSVKPDTTIRVRMIFEGLDEARDVQEQPLTPAPARTGFTLVEWGGTDLTK